MIKNTKVTLKNDSYTLLKSLGAGGQGSIWKVRRDNDDTEWVMKSVLTVFNKTGRSEKASTRHIESNKQRLQNEINFLESLGNAEQHYIVPCIDSGFIEDKIHGSLPSWIMPYYPKILEARMPPYSSADEIPSFLDCLKWIKQIATALQATHAFKTNDGNFIHRDVKAANMMLTDKEDIRLIDFGIARETLENQDTSTRSFSAEAQAPEQVLASRFSANKNFYSIGSHSDIYALGIVIYRLLTEIYETEAQVKLSNSAIRRDHDISISDGGTGKLGKIGGLSTPEYSELVTQVQGRLEDDAYIDSKATQISSYHDSLPAYETIAESFADFVRLLLHADYKKRPSASNVIHWVDTLQKALLPELSSIRLQLNKEQPNNAIAITVITKGKGLPASSEWFTLSVDGKRVKQAFDLISNEDQAYGFLNKEEQNWTISLPFSPETGKQNIRVEASVNDTSLDDQLNINEENPAEDLWQAGKHKQALSIQLKDRWLDELQQQCLTKEQANSQMKLLSFLVKKHPNKLTTLKMRAKWLQEEFPETHKPKSKKKLFDFNKLKKRFVNVVLLAVVGAALGAGAYWFANMQDPYKEELAQWKIELNSNDSGKQLHAWRNLKRLISTEGSEKAEAILQSFKQATNELFESDDPAKQKQAIPRLELMANNGIKSAKEKLGLAYQQGNVVDQDWGKAWDLQKQAGSAGEPHKSKIEKSADDILHDKKSTPEERERAYKVAEKAAKIEPAGDPAQKWMEYRYRIGDGVPIDTEQADWWKRRYEGKENKKTYLEDEAQ